MATTENDENTKVCVKSKIEKPIKGNKEKYLSYKLAFGMINNAIKCKCYLQAITIEESIMADRLLSFLDFCGVDFQIERATLGGAINMIFGVKCNPKINEKCQNKDFDITKCSLFKKEKELREFWDARCSLLHGIAKSPSGEGPKISAKDFIKQAKKTAIDGKKLTRWVCDWSRMQIKASQKQLQNFSNNKQI